MLVQESKDWRYRYSAIMSLSQIGEWMDNVKDIKQSLELVLKLLPNQVPKIRYAACHTIGQFSTDMKPLF